MRPLRRSRLLLSILATGVLASISPGRGWSEPIAQTRPARVVNVTPDSAPGWLPSPELERDARTTALAFLAAEDGGRPADAYAMITAGLQTEASLADFSARLRKTNAEVGAVRSRQITQVTWTKDPDPRQAPEPGVYVALDVTSHFAAAERFCGYLVLHQPPSGGPFKVSREESNYITDAVARQLGPGKLKAAWDGLSVRCPNYASGPPASTLAPSGAPAPLPEVEQSQIGYATVAAALAGLRARPEVFFTEEKGWTIATDQKALTLWSFAPKGHPAYPSVVKRQTVATNGGSDLDMSVRCESTKVACDDLVRSFVQLNAEMTASLRRPR